MECNTATCYTMLQLMYWIIVAIDVVLNIFKKVSDGLIGGGSDSTSADNTSSQSPPLTNDSASSTGASRCAP